MKTTPHWAGVLPLAALTVALLPLAAAAIIPFTPENKVELSSVSPQAVVPITGGFRMYVASNSFTILSATSTNQVSWTLEPGVRLSTGLTGADGSSVTSCGIVPSTNAALGLRMYYIGISTAGAYSVLSASSTDGLTWTKETGVRAQRNGGSAFLDSPRPFTINGGLAMRLFYVASNSAGTNPANFRVFSASSTDGGFAFNDEGAVLPSDIAYQVSVTTLTDGRTRLYYSAPLLGQTTASQVLSAISTNGLSFSKETGVRLSTNSATAALTYPVVIRSTASFRWRMFSAYTPSGSAFPFTSSALTLTPVPISLTPNSVLTNQSNMPASVTGEVFSPGLTASLTQSGNSFPLTSITYTNDLGFTGFMNPLNQSIGNWNLVVTNSDGNVGTLVNALSINVPPGSISILDNLFRPLNGGFATITITTFASGQVTAKLFTSAGGLVRTLLDAPMPAGTTTLTWNGKTALGNTVASGVYLLRTTGPKLDRTDKIVVIK